jgi:hypothetical protein
VFWTESGRDAVVIVRRNEGIRGRPKADHRAQCNQGRYEQTNYPRVRVNNKNRALNQFSWQRENDFSVQLLKSEQEIAILQRNFSILNNESRTTKLNFHTGKQRSREIPKVVEDKSNKFNENRTVVQQRINNFAASHTFSYQD